MEKKLVQVRETSTTVTTTTVCNVYEMVEEAVVENPETAVIQVGVKSFDGTAMAGAMVSYTNTDTGEGGTSNTDADGVATIHELPLGNYEIGIVTQPIPGGRWNQTSIFVTLDVAGAYVDAGTFTMWRS